MWRQSLGAPLSTRPGPALDRLYVALMDGRVLSLALVSGQTLWTRTVPGRVTGLVALDDQVVLSTSERDVQSVDLKSGRERWKWRVGGDIAGLAAGRREAHLFRVARQRGARRGSQERQPAVAAAAGVPAGGRSAPRGHGASWCRSSRTKWRSSTRRRARPATSIKAAGEIGAQPFLRPQVRITVPRLITVTRDGQLQAFGVRFEPPPGLLDVLPGSLAVP